MAFYLEKLISVDNAGNETVDKRSLADWKIEGPRREQYNAAADSFAFDLAADALDEEQFPYGTRIKLYRDEEVKFVGWRVGSLWSGSDQMAKLEYQFAGPFEWFFLRKVFQQSRSSWGQTEQAIIAPYECSVILGQKLDGTPQTMAEQVAEIVNFVVAQTVTEYGRAQLQIGDTFPAFKTPADPVGSIMCGEALQKMVRWLGAFSLWFDYTTNPVTVHCKTRDLLTPVSLPISGVTSRIKRRDDLVPSAIHFQYRQVNTINGVDYVSLFHDIACAAGATDVNGVTNLALLPNGLKFQARVGAFDFVGSTVKQTVATITTQNYTPDQLDWWKGKFPELNDYTQLAFAENEAVPQPDVNFPYELLDGTFAPWMDGEVHEVTVTAAFKYTVFETGVGNIGGRAIALVLSCQKKVKVKITDLRGGTYRSGSAAAGDAIPFGLANQLYQIEKVPQYEVTYELIEDEISDACSVKNVLNLSDGRDEWKTMNAQVQIVAWDIEQGKTEITCGPAKHLGEVDLIARLRVNRPFRSQFSIGNRADATASGGDVTLGNVVAKENSMSSHPKVSQMSVIEATVNAHPDKQGIITFDAPTRTILIRGRPEEGSITIKLETGGLSLGIVPVPCCENFINGYRLQLSSAFIVGSSLT